jgi:hypothetical protein
MNNDYFNNAEVILKKIYEQTFNEKKILLKNELSFWSSFVNKKYSLIIKNYTKRDMEKLRKEIELIAEFELEDCGKIYMIRKNL